MYLRRIAIKGFRNFKDLDLSDLPPTMVLVGENGTGKSNLLAALRLVLDSTIPESARYLTSDDFWDGFDAPFNGNRISVTIELVDFESDDAAKAILSDHLISIDPLIAQLTYEFRPKPQMPPDLSKAGYGYILFGGGNEERVIKGPVLRFITLRILPALRDAEGDLGSLRSPLRRMLSELEIDSSQLEEVAESVANASASLLEVENIAQLNSGISSRVDNMVGSTFGVATTLGILPTDPIQLMRSVQLLVSGSKQRGIGQVSLGTANLLYLALLLEQLEQQQRTNEVIATVLAIEEPEAHLHPHLQRVLYRHFLDGDRPIIVTTHSPHVASVSPLMSISLLRNVGDRCEAFDARGLGFDERMVADLQRYLDVTRAEILFAKGVILVEGPTEQFLVSAFARSMDFDLDHHGISVCAIHGTHFAPYVKLLGSDGLNIPFVVITDGDSSLEDVHTGLHRSLALVPENVQLEIQANFNSDQLDAARTKFDEYNIFIGDLTLELDLLPVARDSLLAAFGELEPSEAKYQNFMDEIEAYCRGEEGESVKIIRRLSDIGKGRFAQRLAGHLVRSDCPSYIATAIDRMRQKVTGDV
jgi:putative ATP-dependent endonuclease of OLD family